MNVKILFIGLIVHVHLLAQPFWYRAVLPTAPDHVPQLMVLDSDVAHDATHMPFKTIGGPGTGQPLYDVFDLHGVVLHMAVLGTAETAVSTLAYQSLPRLLRLGGANVRETALGDTPPRPVEDQLTAFIDYTGGAVDVEKFAKDQATFPEIWTAPRCIANQIRYTSDALTADLTFIGSAGNVVVHPGAVLFVSNEPAQGVTSTTGHFAHTYQVVHRPRATPEPQDSGVACQMPLTADVASRSATLAAIAPLAGIMVTDQVNCPNSGFP